MWKPRIVYFPTKFGFKIDTFLALMGTRSIRVNRPLRWWTLGSTAQWQGCWAEMLIHYFFKYQVGSFAYTKVVLKELEDKYVANIPPFVVTLFTFFLIRTVSFGWPYPTFSCLKIWTSSSIISTRSRFNTGAFRYLWARVMMFWKFSKLLES